MGDRQLPPYTQLQILPDFSAFPPVPRAEVDKSAAEEKFPQEAEDDSGSLSILVWFFRRIQNSAEVLDRYQQLSQSNPTFKKRSSIINGKLLVSVGQIQAAAARAALAEQLQHKFITKSLGQELLYHLGGSGGTGPSIKKSRFSAVEQADSKMEDDDVEGNSKPADNPSSSLAVVLFVESGDVGQGFSDSSQGDVKVASEFLQSVKGIPVTGLATFGPDGRGAVLPDADLDLIKRVYKLSEQELELCQKLAQSNLDRAKADAVADPPHPKKMKLTTGDSGDAAEETSHRAFLWEISETLMSSIATVNLKPMK